MKHSEHTLCTSCRYQMDCSLTTDKSFIWSCSEYDDSRALKQNPQEKIVTKQRNFAIVESELNFV